MAYKLLTFNNNYSHEEHFIISSTCPVLHDLHLLSSTGRLMYQPVSICSGAVPLLNHASRDFILTFCTCSSAFPFSVLKVMYDLNFGLDETSAISLFPGERDSKRLATC